MKENGRRNYWRKKRREKIKKGEWKRMGGRETTGGKKTKEKIKVNR